MSLSCSPMRTKTNPFKRKTAISQNRLPGSQVGGKGEEQDGRVREHGVGKKAQEPHQDPSDGEAHHQPAQAPHYELEYRLPEGEYAFDHSGYGYPQDREDRRIVDQALTREHYHHAVGQAQALGDRRGGDRVRGRDDRS